MIEKIMHRDLLVKCAAVVLAIIVWFGVWNEKDLVQTRVFNLDLVVKAPPGKVIISSTPAKVAVTVKGREFSLNRLGDGQVKIEPDLSNAPDGVSVIPIEFNPPYSNLTVLDISPQNLTVDLDTLHSKEVQVGVVARGKPNDDFEAGQPRVEKASVKVSGAKRFVDKVQFVSGEIDISGASSEVRAEVTLIAKDAQGADVTGVQVEPASVDVVVPLTPLPPSKTVPVKSSITGTPKKGYRVDRVTVTPSSVKFRATGEVAAGIDSIALARTVDVSGRDATFTQVVPLQIPPNVIYEDATQVSVRVEIVPDFVEKTFEIPVQPRNVGVQLRWDINPVTVKVTLRGRSDVMEAIKESDIEAYVDAEGLSEGSHNPVVAPVFPAGVELVEITPNHVSLVLEKR
ncbi:MAG TPA: hypothetical protein GXX23_05620 [Firmicutes bacterium]|nr:hypothetical protein [Candidatus Fermentithermobacillaceae bacterium]